MKKGLLPLKICLITILGGMIIFSFCMFPALLSVSNDDPETLQLGYGYMAVFVVSSLGLYWVIKKEL